VLSTAELTNALPGSLVQSSKRELALHPFNQRFILTDAHSANEH
jgi:hypothetical protein